MSLLVPSRQFDPSSPEWMDRPLNDIGQLRDDHHNLQIINRYFGGDTVLWSHLPGLIARVPAKPVMILDLATGSADHPRRIAEWGRRRGKDIRITAVDNNAQTLSIAREECSGYPEIQLEQHSVPELPYPENSFDIVLCSLAIHHFSEGDAIRILQSMHRLSRVGFLVNDLRRSWIGAWTALAYVKLATRNPMTHHDSYVSILRAFTHNELESLARRAGLGSFSLHHHLFFRIALVAVK